MEPGWVQDSFAKNDLKIDRSFKAYLKYIYENVIPEDDSREIQLDLYRKDNGNNCCTFRMIVALSDAKKKTIQLGDGLIDTKQYEEFNFVSNEFAQLKEITETNELKNKVHTEFGNDAKLYEFEFSKPIKEKIYLVKVGGKSNLMKFNAEQNNLVKYFTYDY